MAPEDARTTELLRRMRVARTYLEFGLLTLPETALGTEGVTITSSLAAVNQAITTYSHLKD